MAVSPARTLNARIDAELEAFVADYRARHGLATKSDVIREALRALQRRERELELRDGYRRMSIEWQQKLDPWLDSDLEDTLEAVDRGGA